MHIILLSGGSGKRLWPLSNDIRSKQFIKIFRDDSAPDTTAAGASAASEAAAAAAGTQTTTTYLSMVQRMYRQIRRVDADASVTIATAKSQISALRNQLGDDTSISLEPCRRDTFPAIALATAYLRDVQKISEDDAVVVCPVDPYVDDTYFEALKKLSELAQNGVAKLVVMGMEPTYPSEKYGYVIPKTKDPVSKVSTFKEKPDAKTAAEYISQGALWNGGVFAYKIGYVLEKARELMNFTDYDDLLSRYETVTKISFDYAVAEHEQDIAVLRFAGEWKDLGTWNTLAEAMVEPAIGNVILNETCVNTHVINDLDIPILCMGLKNMVVAASPEGILVSDKEQSSYIKPFVDAMDQQVMFAEKSWGSYQVLNVERESLTVLVTLMPGHRMNYHAHEHRDEVWSIISGEGRTIVDGMEQHVRPGDVITMQAGCRHTIIADTQIKLIEVQLGKEISVHDKIKYTLE